MLLKLKENISRQVIHSGVRVKMSWLLCTCSNEADKTIVSVPVSLKTRLFMEVVLLMI